MTNTETALEKTNGNHAVIPADVSAGALQSALAGDLKRLTSEERLKFYGALCEFTGLNPLSKPFDWLELQGKLILYANKGCAEQLRKIHGVTVEILERKFEHGCHIVRVKATDKTGRFDESVGAVSIPHTATGDVMAIAMMKAETKAKRRVTLSICGLGMIDETEVDSIPHSRRVDPDKLIDQTETASDRAHKLNAVLADPTPIIEVAEVNEFEEPENRQAAKVEEKPVETSSPAVPTQAEAPQAPEPEKQVATPAPAPVAAAPSGAANTATPVSIVLDAKMVAELETVFSEKTPAHTRNCVDYITSQGRLAKGAGLETIPENYAKKILANTRGFHTAVENWVKAKGAQTV